MKMRILVILSILSFPAFASAQSLELFGLTGAIQVWDDESSLGVGAPIGGGIGFRSPHGWGVEALVERQNTGRRFDPPSDVRFDSMVLAGRARLLKYFGMGHAQAYAGLGLGATRVRSTYDYPAGCGFDANNQFRCLTRDVHQRQSTSGAFSGMAGVRIAIDRNVFVRPEFEVSVAGEHMRLGGILAIGGSW